MPRLAFIVIALAASLAAASYLYWRPTLADQDPGLDGLPRRIRIHEALTAPKPMRTIYINREGAQLRGGPDDSQLNISSIVANMGRQHAEIPPFTGSLTRFNATVKCIREKFAAFDVQVVTQRPVDQDYIMVMMGGTVDDLGEIAQKKHLHAYGLSPYNGEPIEHAVVLVFSRAMKEHTRTVCETAAMEIAHAYGLDHARDCHDLMTYLPRCGARRTFVDRAVPCGERRDRPCGDGQATQNSFATLQGLLGAPKALSSSAMAD